MGDDVPSGRVVIRSMTQDDWTDAAAIFAAGIATGDATFETEVPSWEAFDAAHRPDLRFVASLRDGGRLGGRGRRTAAASVYRGVARRASTWTRRCRPRHRPRAARGDHRHVRAGRHVDAPASVLPENPASLSLHRTLGFREVGNRERIGWHQGSWRDVVLLERRSALAGRPVDG